MIADHEIILNQITEINRLLKETKEWIGRNDIHGKYGSVACDHDQEAGTITFMQSLPNSHYICMVLAEYQIKDIMHDLAELFNWEIIKK